MGMVKKLRLACKLCCSSKQILEAELDYIHFYFAVSAIIFKLNKGDLARGRDRLIKKQSVKQAAFLLICYLLEQAIP